MLVPLLAVGATPPKTVMHRLDAGVFDSAGWARAESTNGDFSVLMPGPFNDFTVLGDSAGIADHMEGIGGRAPNGIVFTALKYVYVTKGTAGSELAKYRTGDGLPSASIKPAEVSGNAGLDITYADGDLSVHEVVVIAGEALYTLTVEWPATAAGPAKTMFSPFVNSFRILPNTPPRVENPPIWQHDELNQTYMRSITKDSCIKKTVATLSRSSCGTQQCLAAVGGATGDCVTWASGDTTEFCATFDSRYIDKNCGSDGLDKGRCSLLRGVKSGVCEKAPAK
jgi:hypothetical protein